MVINCLVILLVFARVSSGFSAEVDSKCPLLKLVNGRIRVGTSGRTVRFNCKRPFQRVGVGYTSCIRGRWDADLPVCVKPGCKVPSGINGQILGSYRGAVAKIECDPGYNLVGSSTVYCNGTKWNESFPQCNVTNKNPARSCTFDDSNLCGWSQDPNHDVDWRRSKNHNGTAMFIGDPATPVKNWVLARLYSPIYPAHFSEGGCFRFKYYLNNNTTGSLRTYVKLQGQDIKESILTFEEKGNHGEDWYNGSFRIPPSEYPFQIVVEGFKNTDLKDSVGFDEAQLLNGTVCYELDMTSTTSATDIDDFDLTSCKDRCRNDSSLYTENPELTICGCHSDCYATESCCSDYRDECTVSATEAATENKIIPQAKLPLSTKAAETVPTIVPVAKTIPVSKTSTTRASTTVSTPVIVPVRKNPTFPLPNQEVNIIPRFHPSARLPFDVPQVRHGYDITNKTVLLPTSSTTTPRIFTQNNSVPRFPVMVNPSILKPVQSATLTTGKSLQQAIVYQDRQEDMTSFSLVKILLLLVAGCVAILLLGSLTFVFLIRRKRKSQRENMAEYSDVRLLTSDQNLDFTLARPVDDDL